MFTKCLTLAAVLITAGTAAFAEDRQIGFYMAYLGPEDLVNSSGVRLTSVPAIVAQDRANFHRFGIRHSADQSDPWFANRGHRMAIEQLVDVAESSANIIVRQGALVAVSVFADATGQMTSIRVEIPG